MIHIVCTKLNIGQPEGPWFDHRWLLFRKYTLPSMLAQTGEFVWVILLDVGTPEEVICKINDQWYDACGTIQSLRFCLTTYRDIRKDRGNLILDLIGDHERIITSRLDSDDALHRECIERVNMAAEVCSSATVIDKPEGYVIREGAKKALRLSRERCNHFVSLVETRGWLETAYNHRHLRLGKIYPTVSILTPMWLRVIHEMNTANVMPKHKKCQLEDPSLERFGIRIDGGL